MSNKSWINSYATGEQIQKVKEAVQKAEASTSGEIVPMIVRSSSATGHVPVILACMLTILFFVFDIHGLQSDLVGGHWALWTLYLLDILDVVLILAVSMFLSRFHWVQRILTTQFDQERQVNQRAEIEFFESSIKKTAHSTGVLIFVSLMEHRAVVLADKTINEKVSKETWQELCNILIDELKRKDISSGFIKAVNKCSDILTPLFPIQTNDVNELKDYLIIKE